MSIKQKIRHQASLSVLLSASLLGGCTMGPNFQAPGWASPPSGFAGPKEPVRPPESKPVAQAIDPQWWHLFGDPQLTKLEEQVASENLDVKAAAYRIAESRHTLGFARGGLFPTLGGNLSYGRQQSSNRGFFSSVPQGEATGSEAN